MATKAAAVATPVAPVQPVAEPKKTKKGAKPKAVAKTSNWAEKFRAGTIGRQIADAIVSSSKTNEEILQEVKKAKKDCKTTYQCVAWYRSGARKAGAIK
jgi:hypothetical protein